MILENKDAVAMLEQLIKTLKETNGILRLGEEHPLAVWVPDTAEREGYYAAKISRDCLEI